MRQVSGSKHLTNLIVKFILFTIVLALLVPGGTNGRYTFGGVLWLAVALTLLSYLVGDLWILPGYGNWTAVAADAGLVLLGLWALPPILGTPGIPFGTMLVTALLLGVGEFYFHRYLQGELQAMPAGGGRGPAGGERRPAGGGRQGEAERGRAGGPAGRDDDGEGRRS
ncbi:MAG TPA: DUF2512 family protein [Bacillota bacterium]